ncbi:MAG: DMT family transporter [Burkholderiaceae bacterium]
MPNYTKGVLFCLIATISWGAMFPVMNSALLYIDPFTFTSLRYLIAGLAFLALLIWREGAAALRLGGERIGFAWFFGTAGFAGFGFLVFLGQQLAGKEGALTASITMATQPMLGLLVNWIIRKIAPPAYSFLFILLSFCGVILVVTKGNLLLYIHEPQSLTSNILILLGALCWVLYTIGATFFPKWSPYKYTTVTTALGLTSVFTINGILYLAGTVAVPSLQAITSILPHLAYMSLVAGFVGVLCWNIGNKILTPLNGVLFMDVVPLTAFVISSLQGAVPVGAQLLGGSFTALALILNNLYLRTRQMDTKKILMKEVSRI